MAKKHKMLDAMSHEGNAYRNHTEMHEHRDAWIPKRIASVGGAGGSRGLHSPMAAMPWGGRYGNRSGALKR